MIIGIVGFIGSGKSTVGDIIEKQYGFERDSFAATLKDVVSVCFGWPRELLEGDTAESREFREKVDLRWSAKMDRTITPRIVLQEFGTEVFRNSFHKDFWLYTVMNRYEIADRPKTVITDVRFINEMGYIRESGGHIVWVRNDIPDWANAIRNLEIDAAHNYMEYYNWKLPENQKVHISEWGWVPRIIGSDWVIDNTGSIHDLNMKVARMMKEFGEV